MAIASVGTLGATANKTNGSSIVHTVTATAEVDNIVVVAVAVDNANNTNDTETNQITSVTDSTGSNTWNKAGEWTANPGGANTGAVVAVFWSKLDSQLSSGSSTITANFDASYTAKAISAWEFTVGTGKTLSKVASDSQAFTTGPGDLVISGLSSLERLYFRADAGEDNEDILTLASTNFTLITGAFTTGGTAASNIGVDGQFRINTSTGESGNPGGPSNDHPAYFFAFEEADEGAQVNAPRMMYHKRRRVL